MVFDKITLGQVLGAREIAIRRLSVYVLCVLFGMHYSYTFVSVESSQLLL